MFERRTATPKEVLAQYQERLLKLDSDTSTFTSLPSCFQGIDCVNVLSIGCGDEIVEKNALEPILAKMKLDINYVGIDIDPKEIQKCNDQFTNDGKAHFYVMDALNYEDIRKLFEGQIHIIVLRHPLLFEDNPLTAPVAKCFRRIITTTVPYLLAEGGVLLTTLYHPEEQEIFTRLMQGISKNEAVELPESKKTFLHVEVCPTSIGIGVNREIDVYTDRYFSAQQSFSPSLAIEVEMQNGNFEIERNDVKPIVDAMKLFLENNSTLTSRTEIIQRQLSHVIQVAVGCKGENITEIANAFSEPTQTANIDVSNRIAYDIAKRKPELPETQIRYNSIVNAIVEVASAGGSTEDCCQALALLIERPVLTSTQPNLEMQLDNKPVNNMPGGLGW